MIGSWSRSKQKWRANTTQIWRQRLTRARHLWLLYLSADNRRLLLHVQRKWWDASRAELKVRRGILQYRKVDKMDDPWCAQSDQQRESDAVQRHLSQVTIWALLLSREGERRSHICKRPRRIWCMHVQSSQGSDSTSARLALQEATFESQQHHDSVR